MCNKMVKPIVFKLVLPCLIYATLTKGNDFEGTLGHIRPRTSVLQQENAVKKLIERLIGKEAVLFNVSVTSDLAQNGKDVFKMLKSNDSRVVSITGSSGVAAAWGFHHYLKYYCMCHVSWDADQLDLPLQLPEVNITITSNDRLRYYQNVCTTSYSFVWWDWNRWQREIDWMALNGFNLALAFNGQEAIWRDVYSQLGLTALEIDEHFAGPAFLSWGRMGNLRGWGGPLTPSWHQNSIVLQHKILDGMRQIGITPVLPAFAGQVPRAFKRVFPNADLKPLVKWNNFSDNFCCPYLLSPLDPLFHQTGTMFLEQYSKNFGIDHVYNCDTFNEMTPESTDIDYLRNIGHSIYRAMSDIDPHAIWMLQGWIFKNEAVYWNLRRSEAFLASVPIGRMLVLDLQADIHPQHERLKSFFGQPYVWCMLHNFGGTLGMHGSASVINEDVTLARNMNGSSMVGIGITPEGINQNYVIYDLMTEMGWRSYPTDLASWFLHYSRRRYGLNDSHLIKAWMLLKDTVYNYRGSESQHGKYIFVHSPNLHLKSDVWYDVGAVLSAWDMLLAAATSSPQLLQCLNYRHDVVDVTRQALQLLLDRSYAQIVSAFKQGNVVTFRTATEKFISLLTDTDKILATNRAFLLGAWINAAKLQAQTPLEEQLYEMNARNQITLWGPNGEIKDYANKQWAGLVSHYYKPRWELFFTALNQSLADKVPFNQTHVNCIILKQIEQPFTTERMIYPDAPTGDSVKVAKEIHKRWRFWRDI